MSKRGGGLGFREIHGFNLALLGKQCWNLVHRPEALVSRVLKAKYYPHSHFLQASRTGGSSFTWSGIWEAKEEMKKGLRWVLGDGKTINIASDRWLRSKADYCVERNQLSEQALNMKVHDFFQQGNKSWDVEKLRRYFTNEDVDAILSIRIPQGSTRDRLAWVHASSGKYSVKSGYYQWCQQHIGDVGVVQSRGGASCGSSKFLTKLRSFYGEFVATHYLLDTVCEVEVSQSLLVVLCVLAMWNTSVIYSLIASLPRTVGRLLVSILTLRMWSICMTGFCRGVLMKQTRL